MGYYTGKVYAYIIWARIGVGDVCTCVGVACVRALSHEGVNTFPSFHSALPCMESRTQVHAGTYSEFVLYFGVALWKEGFKGWLAASANMVSLRKMICMQNS